MSLNNFDTKLGQYVGANGQLLGSNPTIFTPPTDDPQMPAPQGLSQVLNTKKALSGTPTYIPTSFSDQFYFQNNGSLWVYINNAWVDIGTGNMIQAIGTSLPTASTYSGQYYYLTTTDTLYRSNGTAWIALN